MEESTLHVHADDGTLLFVRRWRPEGQVRAVLQLVHGKSEHSGRYGRLAGRLCDSGIEVWADDHRGHGMTADATVNGSDRGGLLGHCADRDGFFRVVRDLELLGGRIAEEHPGKPLFLLGHSWGSFLAQACMESFGSRFAGAVLSGSRGPGGPEIAIGSRIAAAVALLRGRRRFSPLVFALADGPYNRAFQPARTDFDWLTRDESEVDAYMSDPLCGFSCSASFYRDLAAGLAAVHRPEAMDRIPTGLPVFIFSGSADPVGNMGASPTALVEAYRSRGISDLEFVLYPEGRHEMLNETNREEVTRNLLSWIERHLA